MRTIVSSTFRQKLIDVINKNNNVNYNIDDITCIRINLGEIYIWTNDGNYFNIICNILDSIENK